MRYHLRHFGLTMQHKYWVFCEGRKLNVPLLQLLIHDWSKFLPDEWMAYIHFYRGAALDKNTMEKHHQRNRHHPEWWVKDGEVLPMEDRFRREMLADWRAVGRVKGNDVALWYQQYGVHYTFHPETRAWLEQHIFRS